MPEVPALPEEVSLRSLSFVEEPLVEPLLLVAPGEVPVLPPSPVAEEPERLIVPLPEADPEAEPLAVPPAPGEPDVGPPLPVADPADPVVPLGLLGDPLVAPLSLPVPVEEPLPSQPAKPASAAAVTMAIKDFLISMKYLLCKKDRSYDPSPGGGFDEIK